MAGYEDNYHTEVHEGRIKNALIYEIEAQRAKNEYLGDVENKDLVLDFGCGVGQNIYSLKNAMGYDISKYARDFCKGKGIPVIDDINKIEDGSIDVILCSHVLEHVESPFNTLLQINKKLKKKGRLILILPLEGNYKTSYSLDIHQHLFAWNFRTINNLLCKTNFTPVENKVLNIPTGYKKLLFISRFHPKIYELATRFAGVILGFKELKIVSIKN